MSTVDIAGSNVLSAAWTAPKLTKEQQLEQKRQQEEAKKREAEQAARQREQEREAEAKRAEAIKKDEEENKEYHDQMKKQRASPNPSLCAINGPNCDPVSSHFRYNVSPT